MTTKTAPRKIARRAFAPKPWTAGEAVEFADGRSGIVWSDGPEANSVWVAEDGDTDRMVAVKKPTAKTPARILDEVTRAESLRRVFAANRLLTFAVVEKVEPSTPVYEYNRDALTRYFLHTDPACPLRDETHEEHPLREATYLSTSDYVGALLQGKGRDAVGGPLWCACVEGA